MKYKLDKMMKLRMSFAGLLILGLFIGFGDGFSSMFNDIFRSKEISVNKIKQEIKMIAVGDIMLSRAVEIKMIQKNDFKYPFLKTVEITRNADIVFGNLETSIISGRIIQDNEMIFRTDPKSVEGLKFAGFNVLSLANNHTMNFGKDGLESTLEILDENGISHIGAGLGRDDIYRPLIKNVNGTKFAFLGFTYNFDQRKMSGGDVYGVANMQVEKMKEAVQNVLLESDIVIVSMHAGVEYKTLASTFQENFARSAIDAGADLVIGHHPHVVQGVEKYNQGYIVYSLGNFVFDQMWSNETRLGTMVEIIFQDKKVKSIEFIPIKIHDYSQPEILIGSEKEMILKRLKF
ncbi:MAG: CapA family protein [Patescibacteria group bacterium]|nr:CapA family protein [Patescibacteria group bacterium]